MPSLNRPAKACELASFSLNKTGPAPWAVFSDIRYASHTHNLISRGCPAVQHPRATLADIVSERVPRLQKHRFRGHNQASARANKKRSRRCRRLEGANREASNRVDRSHSTSRSWTAAVTTGNA